MAITILGIESSCDDTSAAVIRDGMLLSNVVANQEVHRQYGGVVPEIASRTHQVNIIPVVDKAIKDAGIDKKDVSAVAFTRGPGLFGSLIVGTSFAKGFAIANNIPIIEVNHMHGHILANFIKESPDDKVPEFPFLILVVSGGHTQIALVKDYFDVEILGSTLDDAAGEAFDKCAKIMGLGYPGGPVIDKLAKQGDPYKFEFPKPKIKGLNFSFSGLKTAFLYLVRDELKKDKDFIEKNKADLAASLQRTIVEILISKLKRAIKETGIKQIAIGGGVAANSELREAVESLAKKMKLKAHIPKRKFTTDNAAMIAIIGYYKYMKKDFAPWDIVPLARTEQYV